jgi:hypothetical protein
MPRCRFSDLGQASGAHGPDWVAEGDRWPWGGSGNMSRIGSKQGGTKSRSSPPGRTSRRGPHRAGRNRSPAYPSSGLRSRDHLRFTMSNSALFLEQQNSFSRRVAPELCPCSPPRGADGAPRGAPGVGPHACRVAWGALARRRSSPAPRDDRLLALQPWRLFLSGSLPSPIGFGGRRPLSACQGAWPAGARIPRRAVTSRCGGDATALLRLRDRLRRRPSNEQG